VVAYPGRDDTPPRIRPEEIARRARETGPLRLLFVGNVISRKGLHVLLSALAQLSAEDFQLEVVGDLEIDRAYARGVQALATANRMGDRVTFLGKISEAELADRMRSAHLMAVPSSYEGFGIIYLEGMGSGLPALAGARGAAQEIVTEGETGFLIEPGDSAGLKRCLRTLYTDRECLIRMSLAARRRYEAQPTWEQTAARIRNFLQAL
jgi:glycosyltransferase involved in cell wall biosynthesis